MEVGIHDQTSRQSSLPSGNCSVDYNLEKDGRQMDDSALDFNLSWQHSVNSEVGLVSHGRNMKRMRCSGLCPVLLASLLVAACSSKSSPNTGGTIATGGIPGSGGVTAVGGAIGTGGVLSSGGADAAGGTPGAGGVTAVGGTIGTGGILSTGTMITADGSLGVDGVAGASGTTGTGGTLYSNGGTPGATGGTLSTGGSGAGGTTGMGGISGTGACAGKPVAPWLSTGGSTVVSSDASSCSTGQAGATGTSCSGSTTMCDGYTQYCAADQTCKTCTERKGANPTPCVKADCSDCCGLPPYGSHPAGLGNPPVCAECFRNSDCLCLSDPHKAFCIGNTCTKCTENTQRCIFADCHDCCSSQSMQGYCGLPTDHGVSCKYSGCEDCYVPLGAVEHQCTCQ
jgi:hypothetical protein